MSHSDAVFPDDILGDRATPEQKQQRLIDITNWLAFFAEDCRKLGGEIRYVDDAAKQINHVYWETLEERVRPRITSMTSDEVTVDRHKICSLTELVIAYTQPIEHSDPYKKNDLSARLAYYCALNILGCWDQHITSSFFVSPSFEREHLAWVRNLNHCSEDFPIFSNAATWYLVELVSFERADRKNSV